jgi:hypothetical protein
MEIHFTARQRAKVAELLADESNAERLGACSIDVEADYVIVKFGRVVVCVDENGQVI